MHSIIHCTTIRINKNFKRNAVQCVIIKKNIRIYYVGEDEGKEKV